jgi:hypothetical protein
MVAGLSDPTNPRERAASKGKLIITSAAVSDSPANHVLCASTFSMKSRCTFNMGRSRLAP